MADKVAAGQPIPRSAALWNNIIDCTNDYTRRRALGEPSQAFSEAIATDVVRVKNSTGDHVRLGEIMDLSDFLLTDVLRTSLWFDGDIPDGVRQFAIALQDIPSGAIDRAQVSGMCVALVNVTDENHGYAISVSGDVVLQSAAVGPIRIVYKPTGTGEKTCAVLFVSALSSGLVELCAQEAATRNTPYTALLGAWNAATQIWCYDSAPTVYAIDHRFGAAFAEVGWKGLYLPMPSTGEGHGGIIYVCVSLDCAEPPEGCNTCEEA
jgi:hypothetical protein